MVVNDDKLLNLSEFDFKKHKKVKRSIFEEEYEENSGDVSVNFNEEQQLKGIDYLKY